MVINNADPLREAVDILSLGGTASLCGVSYVAVSKWLVQGLPRSEWTGETNYCRILQKATGNKVKRTAMLAFHAKVKAKRKADLKAARLAAKAA